MALTDGFAVRILALDIGEKRCGLAVSDSTGKIALPLRTLHTRDVFENSAAFQRVLADYEPDLLLCGLPVSLSGHENQQAIRIREQAESVAGQIHLPLEFMDERLSSANARRILRESGYSERAMREKVDAVAASLILQSYLDVSQNAIIGS